MELIFDNFGYKEKQIFYRWKKIKEKKMSKSFTDKRNPKKKEMLHIFYNIFKYMIFQWCQKALLWSKGLSQTPSVNAPRLYFFFMLNSAEQEIYPAHKC